MKRCLMICLGIMMLFGFSNVKADENDHMEIHQISVGTGDGCLIRYFEDGEDYNVVIDGGYGTAFLKKYRNGHYPDVKAPTALDRLLKEELEDEVVADCIAQFQSEKGKTNTGNDTLNYLNGLSFQGEQLKLDYVINSHPHYDHASGLASIAYNYKVKNYILWSQDTYSKFYDLFRKVVDKKVEGISYTINEDDKGITTITHDEREGSLYKITYNNGTDEIMVPEGATVSLSADPEEGYTFKTFSAVESTEDVVPDFVQIPGKTFTMPGYNLIVKATYEKKVTKKANLIIPSENYSFQLGNKGPVFKQLANTSQSYRKSNFSDGTANTNMNNQSLAWSITYAGRKFVTSGDLQRTGEAKIISNHKSAIANADIYKQDHHGFVNADGYSSSTYSGHYAYAKAVNASETIISYGNKEGYGVYGCTTKVLNDSKHSYVYKTYTQGTIVATIQPDGSYKMNQSASVKGTKSVSRGALTSESSSSSSEAETSETYTPGTYKTTTDVPIRSGPATTYTKLGVLSKGTVVEVDEVTKTKWAVINYQGQTAYFSLLNTTKVSEGGSSSQTSSQTSSQETSQSSDSSSTEVSTSETSSTETSSSETSQAETKTLTVPSTVTVYKGDTLNLNATASPSTKITYSSNKKKVATVTSSGVVKGIKAGSATITVKAHGITKKVAVKVINKTLTLNKTKITIKKGKTAQIKATTKPSATITYKSSKTSVARVSSNGVITGVKKGRATITVRANGLKKTVKVTVK